MCPKCGKEIKKQTVDQMVDHIMELPERTKLQLLAPVVRGRKGTHAKLLEQAKKSGYALIVGKIQQNLTKSYVMSAWVNFKIVIRKKGKPMNRKRKIG